MLTKSAIYHLIAHNIKDGDRGIDIEMTADQIAARISAEHDARVTELLQHNNDLEDRARKAEREVIRLTSLLHRPTSADAGSLDLHPIKARLAAATPGPWGSCDACKCPTISSPDYPVATVTKGKWGDDYASIRLVGSSLDLKAEAYMEQITYGEVSEEQALANRTFIREAPTDIARLIAAVERMRQDLEAQQ